MSVEGNLVRVLISEADNSYRIERIKADLPVLQKIVGGYIEALYRADWHCYFNEEGKIARPPLEINVGATVFMDSLIPGFARHDELVGPVVWLGNQGPEEASVTPEIIRRFTDAAIGRMSEIRPIAVIRWGNDVWVYDDLKTARVATQVMELVTRAQGRAHDGNGFGTIEVYPLVTKTKWVEIRVELMDRPGMVLHDEREDRSYG